MGKIDYGRVVIGGVVAGIVFLLTDFVGMQILGMDMEAWAAAHSLVMPPMWVFIAFDILLGILLVWLYAAIRPRFGAGTKTALIAAAFFWVFFGLIYYVQTRMGLFEMGDYVKMAAWGVVQVAAAALAGAWLYREGA